MSDRLLSSDVQPLDTAARSNRVGGRMPAGLLLYALLRTGGALAGDQSISTNAVVNAEFPRSMPNANSAPLMPGNFSAPTLSELQSFSLTEFSPRKHPLLDHDPRAASVSDTPMLHTTTVWQRMADYRSRDRVRLLTLWESNASTVSLQAGKRGDPSLQWTSRWMNHGGSTRGLLDQLFSVSFVGAGNTLRGTTRSNSPQIAPKQVNTGPVVNGK
jgi:hypothetical protein